MIFSSFAVSAEPSAWFMLHDGNGAPDQSMPVIGPNFEKDRFISFFLPDQITSSFDFFMLLFSLFSKIQSSLVFKYTAALSLSENS